MRMMVCTTQVLNTSANNLNCSSGTCSYTVYGLKGGLSKWWIRAKNSAGQSGFSQVDTFNVVPPNKPTVKSPDYNVSTGQTVTFTWWPTAGATEYIVSYNNNGNYNGGAYVNANNLGCSTGLCSFTVNNLVAGSSIWWVGAKSSAGWSGWSVRGDFTVSP